MKNPFGFFVELVHQPAWLPIWVLYLITINLASVGFWEEPLAKLVLFTFLISAMLMLGLYSRYGFEKILGLGHMLWAPLLVYILTQLPSHESSFEVYLFVLSISIAVSLVFDGMDVYKYFADRKRT